MRRPLRADSQSMHSWVFRNRARLRLIYGPASLQDPPAPGRGARAIPRQAGRVLRRARYVLLMPMPPLAG